MGARGAARPARAARPPPARGNPRHAAGDRAAGRPLGRTAGGRAVLFPARQGGLDAAGAAQPVVADALDARGCADPARGGAAADLEAARRLTFVAVAANVRPPLSLCVSPVSLPLS